MADPKYENLPGIAYDQPDVYECGDLPEEDQVEVSEEEENEAIEQLHLSVKDSFNKFKGKFVTGDVDFSDRLGKKIKTGYRAGEWQLAAEGEQETPVERYNRLRCEFSELLEQVTEQQNNAAESEKEDLAKLAAQINSTKKVLEEVKLVEGDRFDPKAEKLKEELLKFGDGKSSGMKAVAHIRLKPEALSLAQTTRIAQLEHRLHRLEATAGVKDEEALKRLQAATGEATLMGAAACLSARAALVRGGELAACEARVHQLLANVDAVKAALRPHQPDLEPKINELHKMMKDVEGISHSEILERMEALECLHNQASNFGKSLSELESLQATISSSLQNNKDLLQGVQEVFAHNVENIKTEIKKLEERVTKLQSGTA